MPLFFAYSSASEPGMQYILTWLDNQNNSFLFGLADWPIFTVLRFLQLAKVLQHDNSIPHSVTELGITTVSKEES